MARLPRVVAAGVAHHITQRANAQKYILDSETHRKVYLDLLRQSFDRHGVSVIGYCLMSNHVHLVATPRKAVSLPLALKDTHGRFAAYWNAVHHSSGHVWQGRYYSCPLDESHLWQALRYTELNPVRAALVNAAEQWPWSSARAHCDASLPKDGWLELSVWQQRWTRSGWLSFLHAGDSAPGLELIRRNTHTGRPLGSSDFTRTLERQMKRQLTPRKRGPQKSTDPDNDQPTLAFEQ